MWRYFGSVCFLLLSISTLGGVDGAKRGTSCNCGWINKGRIVGGSETTKNKYPMMAAIIDARYGQQGCGGTVITPWHVLTAAHCSPDSPADVKVKVGAHNWRVSGVLHDVAKIIMHEKWDITKAVFDISLFVTKTKMVFGSVVGPACLPDTRLSLAGKKVTAIGWGDVKTDGPSSDVLREVQLRVISHQECKKAWSGEKNFIPQENTICTFERGKDTCQFDSGGPILWSDPEIGRLVVAGVVSYGDGCAGPKPGVYTDVSAFLDWITKNVAATKPGEKVCRKV